MVFFNANDCDEKLFLKMYPLVIYRRILGSAMPSNLKVSKMLYSIKTDVEMENVIVKITLSTPVTLSKQVSVNS